MIPTTNEDNRIPEDIYEYGDNYKNIKAINIAMEQAIEKLGFCSGCGVDEFFPAEIECDDTGIVQRGAWDIYVPVSALKMDPMINESQMCMRIGRIVKTIQKTLLDSHPAISSVTRPRLWRIDQYVFSDRERSIHFEPDIDVAFHFNAQITCSVDELWKLLDTPEKKERAHFKHLQACQDSKTLDFIHLEMYPLNECSLERLTDENFEASMEISEGMDNNGTRTRAPVFKLYLDHDDINPERLLYGRGETPDASFEMAWLGIDDQWISSEGRGRMYIAVYTNLFLEYVDRLMTARAKEQS